MTVFWRQASGCIVNFARYLCSDCSRIHHCKLLIIGGGTGGCSVAWRLSRRLGRGNIILLDPSDNHYYQPLFSLVAGGMKKLSESGRPLGSVLPPSVRWLRDSAECCDPSNNLVRTFKSDTICYEYLVVAVGVVNDYYKIPGLKTALDDPYSGVSTIYSPHYCFKTWCTIKHMEGGHAIFTFTKDGTKCPGAALKIMYLADAYFRKKKRRSNINITYVTGGQVIFGVSKYAAALSQVCNARQIPINCNWELEKVQKGQAVFTRGEGEVVTLPFNLLHVAPHMCSPPFLSSSEDLADERGFLDVHKHTLQHHKFANVFGLGDCTNTPNSKTAASIPQQSHVLEQNLLSVMAGQPARAQYDGYGACAMLTSYQTGMLAEFDYDKKLQETFPFDQSKERRLFYQLNNHILPHLYWNKLIKGRWNGPARIRRIINPTLK